MTIYAFPHLVSVVEPQKEHLFPSALFLHIHSLCYLTPALSLMTPKALALGYFYFLQFSLGKVNLLEIWNIWMSGPLHKLSMFQIKLNSFISKM